MKETNIYLIRHGESLGNAKRIYLGHTDLDLSPFGYEQAKIAAERLRDVKFDVIYSSDLLRAHNTAVPHAELRGLDIIDSPLLREIYLGDWENRLVDELVNNEYDKFVVGWKENFGTFTVPGGESVIGAGTRFYNEVLRIARENEGKTILITAHAAVIRVFWCIINQIRPEDMASAYPFPKNASHTTAIFDGERIIPGVYSSENRPESSDGGDSE